MIKKFGFNVLVMLSIIGLVYVVTVYSTPVRQALESTKSAVAGASTSTESLQNSLPSALKEDTQNQIEQVKEQALEVKVGEIFSFFSRAGKIVDDFHALQNDVTNRVEQEKK